MNFATTTYTHRYFAQVAAELLADEDYFQAKAAAAARRYFGPFPAPRGPILEYGCGIGQNLAALDDAVGFDPSPDALDLCRRRGLRVVARREEIPAGHFALVLCRHVLEHVEHPLEVLRELLSYLRQDGQLILVLPKERHRRSALAADLHQHLYCWNFRAINNLIRVAGGQPLHNRYEPMFGPRTHGWLRPVRRLLGFESYYRWGQWTGRLRGHLELVVHARPAQGLGAGPPSPAAAGAGNSDPAWRPAQPESR